jgi:hypothetical protein
MIQRIPKINIPAMVAMCATFVASAFLAQFLRSNMPFEGTLARAECFRTTGSLTITARQQPGAPLAVRAIERDPQTHTTSVTVKNTSGRTISAYCLVGSYGDHNGRISESSYSSDLNFPYVLDVNASYIWQQNLDQVREVWVDFVEFSDGTIWGPNTQQTLEKMNATRIGSRQAAIIYNWSLQARGPQAMLASFPEPITNTQIDQYDRIWRDSFQSGVENVCARLLQDKSNVEIVMNSRSGEAYNAALTERFKQTLQSYINFRH